MSGNPNPQHNPTDGLGTAAIVQLTATQLTNCAAGGLTIATEATPRPSGQTVPALNGQGYGAVAYGSSAHAQQNAQYALTLSLGSKTVNGVSLSNTASVTASVVDVLGNAFTPTSASEFVVKSYGNPDAGTPAWYRPSAFSGYSGDVASASASGATITITAIALGTCIVEVQFPAFEFLQSSLDAEPTQASGDPVMMIYAQIICTVVA